MQQVAPTSSGGVATREARTILGDRALNFLSTGPADAQSLVSYVCQLPNAPQMVAEHLARTLFAGHETILRDADGRWRLRRPEEFEPTVIAEELRALSYVVVDVETTGTRAHMDDRITEIAAVVVRDGQVTAVYETLVNPGRAIPSYISRLTNISWDMVKDQPRFADICDKLLSVLEGHVFVAHNALFDWKFVDSEVQRATGRQLEGRRLCTVRLARKLLPQLRSRSLDGVTAHYGIDIGARHRAGGDAVATAHVLLRLLADARDRGHTSWEHIEQLLGTRSTKPKRRRPPAMPQPVSRDTTA
ncbi:MAG: polymerase epsilon subunit [Gemmatimonadetes bacterium]|nr:polymerase epsilon subunit [Gemmatimonadota bacterium]